MKIILSSIIKKEVTEYFLKKGIDIIYTMPFSNTVSSSLLHPDIQCYYDSEILYTAKNLSQHYKNYFKNICLSDSDIIDEYPSDALFNCLKIDNRIFCNTKYIDKTLYNNLKKKYEIINVNQGYTNCSCLYIGKSIVLTSDNGMKKALLKYGYKVIIIDNNYIKLKDFKNGFIGGCAIKLDDEIVFFGKLENEFEKIKNLLKENQIKFKDFDFPLEDFGSAIIVE